MMGFQLEDSSDGRGLLRIGLGLRPALDAGTPVTIRGTVGKVTVLDPLPDPLLYVPRELVDEVIRHNGQVPTLELPLGRVVDGLCQEDEREVVVGLKTFKLDVVEQVPARTIDFVEQDSVEFVRVLLGIGDELA